MTRLAPGPAERIDRSRTVTFEFDGKRVEGLAGDTIVSALYATGMRTFSRSFKYHRKRGELCGCGQCTNSLMRVNGAPGVRGCAQLIEEGMVARHQNAWPSLRFDIMRATDIFGGPFTPPGFYYKTFIRPRRLWPLYERVLRKAAGLGVIAAEQDERRWRTSYRRRHADLLVVGGGVAGLRAAITAAKLGLDVVLCDDDVEPGGAALHEGLQTEVRLLAALAESEGVEVLTRATALGSFDGLVPIWQDDTLHQVRARRIVFATGTIEQPLVFPNNDLPGIMLAGGARRLAEFYGICPGKRVLIATTGPDGIDAALALHARGIEIAGVADLRTVQQAKSSELERAGIPQFQGFTLAGAKGHGGVRSALIAAVDRSGTPRADSIQKIACDTIAVAGTCAPAGSLLLQAGAQVRADGTGGRFVLGALPETVSAAGSVTGHETYRQAELSGEIAGAEAAVALGAGGAGARTARDAAHEHLARCSQPAPSVSAPAHVAVGVKGKSFVDLDEDVTVKDIKFSLDEGYESIELAKRYTTATMGPSQGKFSQLATARVIAQHSGAGLGEVGLTTARPPWATVPMGVLAGRPLEPAKRSALHQRHRALGATIRWAGDWRRAYDYGDPTGETLAVQEAGGVIDVSTLGKLVVSGPDAGELLDRIYPNTMSSLAVGRLRYGVVTSEAGRVMDDGTVCRLDDETFYITTTSAGAAAMEQWVSWWLAGWDLGAYLTDVTQGVGAMNLAGPRAREVLSQLTDLDCSSEAFKYLDAKHSDVAGVPCLLLRIGFVGEVGYEIHCPASQAQHVWDAIIAAGGGEIRPFGLEPQRVLRLQKLHILVGQDTDSESTPYGAAMPWIVKLDKTQDFIGRWALEHAHDDGPSLVGFRCAGNDVPVEGAAIIDADRRPVGQVTSSRFSPKLGHPIGMAWVPGELAKDGREICISDGGTTLTASVTTSPFYDPEGEVLRS